MRVTTCQPKILCHVFCSTFLLAFMGAMQGVVLVGDLVQIGTIIWELTSLTSFLLIGYWHHRSDARRGARMAFTVTAIGGLALLFGVLMLGHIVGSYDLDVVLASKDTLPEPPLVSGLFVVDCVRRFTEKCPVSVSLLVASRYGGSNPCVGLCCIRPPWSKPESFCC